MAIALGILFPLIVFLYPLFLHLIPMLLLCISALFANLIQAFCFVCIWPISKNTYRTINRVVKELDWLVLVFLIDWWAGIKILVYTDHETIRLMGKEHALVISNARSDADRLVELVLAQRSGCLGSLLAVVEKSAKYIPDPLPLEWHGFVFFGALGLWHNFYLLGLGGLSFITFLYTVKVIGWSMWFSEYIFSESLLLSEKECRSFLSLRFWKPSAGNSWLLLCQEKTHPFPRSRNSSLLPRDERKFKADLQRLKDFPQPFWLSVFQERTGFTQGEILAAQRLPVPRNVLSPHTKDLAYAVRNTCSFVPAIYDVTVAIPKTSPPPTLGRLLKWGPSVVHVHIKRHATKELPETDDAVEKWCTEMLSAKDALLDKHIAEQTFGDVELQAIGRPLKSFLLNFIDWSTLLVFSAALLSGRMFAPLGRRVLSEMQRSIEASLRNISWSEHVVPILSDLIEVLPDLVDPIVYSITGNVVVKNSKLLKQVFPGMVDRLLCIPII